LRNVFSVGDPRDSFRGGFFGRVIADRSLWHVQNGAYLLFDGVLNICA
jgi:hypothetical protein